MAISKTSEMLQTSQHILRKNVDFHLLFQFDIYAQYQFSFTLVVLLSVGTMH